MKALWHDDVASFDGEFVHLPPSWSWPKPARRAARRSSSAARAGPKLFAHVAEYADGWIPIGGAGVRAALADLDRACEARGRDPKTLRIVPFGTVPDAGKLEYYASIGIEEVVLRLPGRHRATRCCPGSTASPSWSSEPAPRADRARRRGRRRRVARRRVRGRRRRRVAARSRRACRPASAITGITGWTLGDVPDRGEPAAHPNGSLLLDHLVVFTDDPDRTIREYAELGLEVRRIRDLGNGKTQTFFRAGEVVIELVGPIGGRR